MPVTFVAAQSQTGKWLDPWQINAFNRLQVENYDNSGNAAASPYPFEGGQVFNQFSVNMNRRVSSYERLNIRFSGLLNDSEYRSDKKGFIPERARFFWEKGDGLVPFRFEGGDFFAFQSLRTIQTGLKGMQAEFQPDFGSDRQHSIQFFAGQQAQTYRDFDGDEPQYLGASWLMQDPVLGTFSFNLSHGHIKQQSLSGSDGLSQSVASLAHTIPIQWWGQSLKLESEVAYLSGDRRGFGTSANEDRHNLGLFFELAGHSQTLPLRYRTTYQEYGQDYAPFGAAIASDQRSFENYATWTFPDGQFIRGRYLYFRDALESSNPVDTNSAGLTYGGTLATLGDYRFFGNLDAFVSVRQDQNGQQDSRNATLNANIRTPLTDVLTARVDLLGQVLKNEAPPTSKRIIRQGTLTFDYDFQIAGLDATLSPGMMVRDINGGSSSTTDWNPVISGTLYGRRHSLRFSYNSLLQQPSAPTGFDTLTQRLSVEYNYRYNQHRFGVQANYYERRPDQGLSTEANRLMVFWEYQYDKPAVPVERRRAVAAVTDMPVSLTRFEPGASPTMLESVLQDQGLGEPIQQNNLLIYEKQLLQSIQRRQRLVYEVDVGSVASSNLIIDFDAIGDGRSAQRVFNEVRALLIQKYGAPEVQIEEGEFGPGLAGRLSTDQFVRVYEWTIDGHPLRFGIPSRTDGLVRMEIRYADRLTPAEQNDWSLTRLR
ncbi:hypothetical protein J2T55_001383 [Methylohalomonas lacus]|uniref:Uncharacterized protein n=1 Tax=Methylohalomonas lacus TaxID=398773 RepID=A0AAE3HMR9_9GAMM|nr:hypothetical protein [Methylohalomonas lacus]MCS3903362.1 hypothetical protein [Methylohalomonas lacus]